MINIAYHLHFYSFFIAAIVSWIIFVWTISFRMLNKNMFSISDPFSFLSFIRKCFVLMLYHNVLFNFKPFLWIIHIYISWSAHVLFSLYLELTYLNGRTSTISVLNFPNRIKQYNQNKRFVYYYVLWVFISWI